MYGHEKAAYPKMDRRRADIYFVIHAEPKVFTAIPEKLLNSTKFFGRILHLPVKTTGIAGGLHQPYKGMLLAAP